MTLVATAGHVDHGKTSLVKQLTGVDTDRLKEEKQRGLTIELGYAFRQMPSGERVGFIDVPGHKRFINTMIAGVSGIDLGMLVVAADDGPMPQTLEHLEVLRLLGVEHFIGVITKIDLVDNDRVEQLKNQLDQLIPSSPVCCLSNKSGEGVEQLLSLLDDKSYRNDSPSRGDYFRLYVDRVFSKKGAGLVVTGTCLSGSVAADDTLYLHSVNAAGALPVRVREVHCQGQAADQGQVGQRCALNIAGKVSREQLQRGSFLTGHPSATPSRRLDARCQFLPNAQQRLKHLGRVKLHIGTRRLGAITYMLDRHSQPQEELSFSQRVQLILDDDVLAFGGDRFVLRSDDERTTLGGGVVIDPVAPQWGKSRQQRLQQLDALELAEQHDTLHKLLFEQKDIVSTEWLGRIWNCSNAALENLLAKADSEQFIRIRQEDDELLVSLEQLKHYIQSLTQAVVESHSRRPMEAGIDPAALQKMLDGQIPKVLFRAVLDDQLAAGQLIYKDQLVHALGHRPTLSHQLQREWQQLEQFMQGQGRHLPLRSEIMTETGWSAEKLEALVRPAIKRRELFEIGEKRLALPGSLVELAERVEEFLQKNPEFSVIEAKQFFGLGRGQTIEILEFMDSISFTVRNGNQRSIANRDAVQKLC